MPALPEIIMEVDCMAYWMTVFVNFHDDFRLFVYIY